MTAEVDRQSPKFDIDGAYLRDEFIYRLECLLLDVPEGDSFRRILESIIEWAEKHDADVVIRWVEAPDGNIYPYVDIEIIIDPKDSDLE